MQLFGRQPRSDSKDRSKLPHSQYHKGPAKQTKIPPFSFCHFGTDGLLHAPIHCAGLILGKIGINLRQMSAMMP
jgi:hypothetical protein